MAEVMTHLSLLLAAYLDRDFDAPLSRHYLQA